MRKTEVGLIVIIYEPGGINWKGKKRKLIIAARMKWSFKVLTSCLEGKGYASLWRCHTLERRVIDQPFGRG